MSDALTDAIAQPIPILPWLGFITTVSTHLLQLLIHSIFDLLNISQTLLLSICQSAFAILVIDRTSICAIVSPLYLVKSCLDATNLIQYPMNLILSNVQ